MDQSGGYPPADKSLALEQLIEAGMPAHDRDWSGNDMTRAANILAAIAQKDAGHLPRYRSQPSGRAFERLTANEILDLYRNRSLPLEQRFFDALNYMQSSNEILRLYLAAFNQHVVGDSELIELAGAQLRVSVVMITLVNDQPLYQPTRAPRHGLAWILSARLTTVDRSSLLAFLVAGGSTLGTLPSPLHRFGAAGGPADASAEPTDARGSGTDPLGAIPWMATGKQSTARGRQDLPAVLTIARIPARIASGRLGQASITACSSVPMCVFFVSTATISATMPAKTLFFLGFLGVWRRIAKTPTHLTGRGGGAGGRCVR